jgi:hypothetical protein
VLLCVSTGLRPCLCPEERAKDGINVVAVLAATGDICGDCGHTKNCCISHVEMPVVGSGTGAVAQAEPQFVACASATFGLSIPNIRSLTLVSSGMNRAPPWSSTQTPIALHQKLII